MRRVSILCAFAAGCSVSGWGQTQTGPQPIYRVTVVSRTLQAVNYEHRGGPTMIDFTGTVLLRHAKGQAVVESKRGRVSIDVKLDHLEAPTIFGTEYLTYVLWAISPEGRAKNLGEILVDSSNKAHINVTTEMQAFGLIVTAEPYYSVTTPSDVVVMENVVRPDTIGSREVISARYDLLPRGGYVMNLGADQRSAVASEGRKLPYDQYEALLEVYQAENAVQIAKSMNADQLAPESFNKAVGLLNNALQAQASSQDSHRVVSLAREAAQTAEDARMIATKRRGDLQQRDVRQSEDQSRLRAEAEAEQARAVAATEERDAERAEFQRDRAEADGQAARNIAAAPAVEAPPVAQRTAPTPPIVARPVERAKFELSGDQRKNRAELLAQLTSTLDTRDTPHGLVVTVTDGLFESQSGDALRPAATERLMQVAAVVKAHPDLTIRVQGFTDDRADSRNLSQRRAEVVRDALIRDGVAPRSVIAAGLGNSRPLESNATPGGREQNRRVELEIAGPSIGNMALWDRTYSLR
jgi:outer membrane protein OmpA-like peptidoglycan-associated protein